MTLSLGKGFAVLSTIVTIQLLSTDIRLVRITNNRITLTRFTYDNFIINDSFDETVSWQLNIEY